MQFEKEPFQICRLILQFTGSGSDFSCLSGYKKGKHSADVNASPVRIDKSTQVDLLWDVLFDEHLAHCSVAHTDNVDTLLHGLDALAVCSEAVNFLSLSGCSVMYAGSRCYIDSE